jgi:hypothetical protein
MAWRHYKPAQAVLTTRGDPEDFPFPDVTPESVSMAFHRVCKALGIPDIRLHDLRHAFATWLRQRGTELDVIASQLGHRDLRITKRHARIASAQVRDAVSGLDSVLSVTQEGEKALVSYLQATGKQLAEVEKAASLLNCWRPRRDLNPCYRGERADNACCRPSRFRVNPCIHKKGA